MSTLLVILGINAVLLGSGFLFAGYMVVTAPSDAERTAVQASLRAEQARSWWRAQLFALRYASYCRSAVIARFVSQWSDRPHGRTLVYAGVVCLVVAVVIGYHFGVFAL
jgi:hypothetical protein